LDLKKEKEVWLPRALRKKKGKEEKHCCYKKER